MNVPGTQLKQCCELEQVKQGDSHVLQVLSLVNMKLFSGQKVHQLRLVAEQPRQAVLRQARQEPLVRAYPKAQIVQVLPVLQVKSATQVELTKAYPPKHAVQRVALF